MNPYLIVRKVIQDAILIVLMAVVLFVVYRLMPGNPAELLLFGAKKAGLSPPEIGRSGGPIGLSGWKMEFCQFHNLYEGHVHFQFTVTLKILAILPLANA